MRDAEDVTTIELKVAEATVGRLRMRARERRAGRVGAAARDDADRLRGRARPRARARLRGGRDELPARGARPAGSATATTSSPAARSSAPTWRPAAPSSSCAPTRATRREDDWRRRLLAVAGARRAVDRARLDRRADRATTPARSSCSCPIADGETGRRVAVGDPARARVRAARVRVRDRAQPPRRGSRSSCTAPRNEALLAANVVEGEPERAELGVRGDRHLPAAAAVHEAIPAELKRFYAETVRPLVAYDEQYETDLLGTLATFLDCDANVNATAARLITHRHTVRYRFERVRELTGLDVSSTDGREKLSLGLKAMRVLGIARAARAGDRARRRGRPRPPLGGPRPRPRGGRGIGPPPPSSRSRTQGEANTGGIGALTGGIQHRRGKGAARN